MVIKIKILIQESKKLLNDRIQLYKKKHNTLIKQKRLNIELEKQKEILSQEKIKQNYIDSLNKIQSLPHTKVGNVYLIPNENKINVFADSGSELNQRSDVTADEKHGVIYFMEKVLKTVPKITNNMFKDEYFISKPFKYLVYFNTEKFIEENLNDSVYLKHFQNVFFEEYLLKELEKYQPNKTIYNLIK